MVEFFFHHHAHKLMNYNDHVHLLLIVQLNNKRHREFCQRHVKFRSAYVESIIIIIIGFKIGPINQTVIIYNLLTCGAKL